MKKNGWLLIIVLVTIYIKPLYTQDRVFLIPGIKFTRSFGGNQEIILGIDLSFVIENGENKPLLGLNATYDFIAEQKKITFGAEYIDPKFLYGGISTGAAINLTNKSVGVYATGFFTVMMVIPAFQYTWFFNSDDVGEFGLFGKIPLKIGGSKSGYFDMHLDMSNFTFNTE